MFWRLRTVEFILDESPPLAIPPHLVFGGRFDCAGPQRGHRVEQGVLRRLAEQRQEHGHTETSGSLPLLTIHIDDLLIILEEICLISNYAQYILTAWTGEAMSTCTQMPGQSKPRWEPMKRPAQELCAFSRSCGHRTLKLLLQILFCPMFWKTDYYSSDSNKIQT